MELKNQVCSLELSKKLKELGVRQESLFVWSNDNERTDVEYYLRMQTAIEILKLREKEVFDWCSAFTVAELWQHFPQFLRFKKGGLNEELSMGKNDPKNGQVDYDWISYGFEADFNNLDDKDRNLANICAKMLIYLLENNLIKLKQ